MAEVKRFFRFLKSKFFIFTVIVVAGGAAYYFFAPEEQVVEQIYVATKQNVVQSVLLSGTVDAVDNVNLSFGIAGKIDELLASVGDVVEEGDMLARLDLDILEADLLKAEGDIAASRAAISIAEASVKKAEANLALVQADNRGDVSTLESAVEKLADTKSEQEILVSNARKQLLDNDLQAYPIQVIGTLPAFTISGSYTGDLEGAYELKLYISSFSTTGYSIDFTGIETGVVHFNDYNTPQPLGELGLFITFPSSGAGLSYNNTLWEVPVPNVRSATYQTKLSAFNSAQVNANLAVTNAEEQVERLQAEEEEGEIALTSAEEQQAQAALEEAQATLKQSKSTLQQSLAALARVEAQLEDGVIFAPFSGTIARVDFIKGETVAANEAGLTLITDGNFELSMNVPEIDIAKIKLGDESTITLDAYGPDLNWQGSITGIELIETEVDGVPVYETSIVVNNPDDRIRVGMNARAEIVLAEKNDVLAIPSSYITDGTVLLKRQAIKEGEDSVYIERPVEVGLRGSNNFVEIRSGLEVGNEIVKPES